MAENRVIGQGNQIPWHLPEDFRWFKQKTMGQVLVMGRLTYQSIGRALPGRQTLIMSRSGFEAEGLLTLDSVDALLAWSKDQERTLFICGGALLYAQLLEYCSDLFLSRVQGKPQGDAFFPPFEHLFDSGQVLLEAPEFSVTHHRALMP